MQIIHLISHALEKRGKQGLLRAMRNMQNELMCLGFATLVLLLFQSSLTSYCSKLLPVHLAWQSAAFQVMLCICFTCITASISSSTYNFNQKVYSCLTSP